MCCYYYILRTVIDVNCYIMEKWIYKIKFLNGTIWCLNGNEFDIILQKVGR